MLIFCVPEDANTVNGSPRTMKAETIGAEKGPLLVKIAGNAEGNGSVKRKLRDLGDFIEKPFELDRFQAIKSSGKATSLGLCLYVHIYLSSPATFNCLFTSIFIINQFLNYEYFDAVD